MGYLIAAVAALVFIGALMVTGDVIISSIIALVGSVLLWGPIAARRERQRKNELAQDIHIRIGERREAPIEAFFFYLRSFASDAATTESWQLTQADGTNRTTQSGSPKAVIEILLEPAGKLIELGGKQHLSLGQVTVADENWWFAAEGMIIHATAIFISPGSTEAVRKEAEFILGNQKIRRRTFLIMEPTHETMLSAAYGEDRTAAADRSARWARVQDFYRDRGVPLPAYQSSGAVVSLFDPKRWIPFVGMSRHQLFDLLQGLYVDLGKLGSYDIDPGEDCPCKSGREFRSCHSRKRADPVLQSQVGV